MIRVNMQETVIDGNLVQLLAELSQAGAAIADALKEKQNDRRYIFGLFMRVLSNSLLGETISGKATNQEIFDMIEAWVAEGDTPTTLN